MRAQCGNSIIKGKVWAHLSARDTFAPTCGIFKNVQRLDVFKELILDESGKEKMLPLALAVVVAKFTEPLELVAQLLVPPIASLELAVA